MEMNDANVSTAVALISGIGVIITAWLGFMGSKKGTLASAENEFRNTLLEDNRKLRQRIDELEDKLTKITLEHRKLQLYILQQEAGTIDRDEILKIFDAGLKEEGGDHA